MREQSKKKPSRKRGAATPKEGKVKRAFRVSSIVFGIAMFLIGAALLAFFVWLFVSIGAWIGTA